MEYKTLFNIMVGGFLLSIAWTFFDLSFKKRASKYNEIKSCKKIICQNKETPIIKIK